MSPAVKHPLNAGDLLSQTIFVCVGKFAPLLAIAVVPNLLVAIVWWGVTVQQANLLGTVINDQSFIENGLLTIAAIATKALSFVLLNTLTILAVNDLIFRSEMPFAQYPLRFLQTLPAVLISTTAVFVLVFALPLALFFVLMSGASPFPVLSIIAFCCATIFGAYFLARYWVYMPAILIGGDGMYSVGQSAYLSRDYRWSIVGTLLVIAALGVLILMGLMYLFQLFENISFLPGYLATIDLFPISILGDAIVCAFSAILMATFTVLLYSRLRELKEGLGLTDIAAIFE